MTHSKCFWYDVTTVRRGSPSLISSPLLWHQSLLHSTLSNLYINIYYGARHLIIDNWPHTKNVKECNKNFKYQKEWLLTYTKWIIAFLCSPEAVSAHAAAACLKCATGTFSASAEILIVFIKAFYAFPHVVSCLFIYLFLQYKAVRLMFPCC